MIGRAFESQQAINLNKGNYYIILYYIILYYIILYYIILYCHHASLLMIVSTIEHLTTPLFLSQIVRNQLLATNAMYKQNT